MNPKLTLLTKSIEADGAFGELWIDAAPVVLTLEKTFDELGNRPKIPAGVHNCTRTHFERGGYDTFEIHVEGHTRLLFHKANLEDQLDGCIAVGSSVGILNGHKAILGSAVAFDKFWELVKNLADFDLQVEGR